MSSSTKLAPSLVLWVNSVELPCLQELDAATGKPKRVVAGLSDLGDGVVLGDVVGEVDPAYFRPLSASSNQQKALAENWVLRFNNLKRLYKLLIRYFEDVLHATTVSLPAPNLQLIAKGGEGSDEETCKLAGIVLALVVQSEKRQQHVERIQSLDEWVQREIMWSIEQVMSKVGTKSDRDKDAAVAADADSEFYALQHERSQLLNDKETLQVVYEELVRTYSALKDDHEQALSSLVLAEARAADAIASGKNDRADVAFKAEFDRLRTDLQKAENDLGESEQLVERQSKMLEDLTRKVDDLQPRADEAARLKDQMDEYRHAAEKGKKTENVIEKFRKKLEESADLRRTIKTLEDQNSDLLDANASLEEEYKKVSAFKPLMESYKLQLETLELKSSSVSRENDVLRHEVERAKARVTVAEGERAKESEALVLYEERVKELELGAPAAKRRERRESQGGTGGPGGGTGVGEEGEDDDGSFAGVGGELDDAISGTTMTDLKLRVRRLTRELETAQANKADGSRIVVLENLLEDANRMKSRYESDYLREHREKLVVKSQLDEILSGKSRHGDGPEVAMALRMRLNETVDELEKLKRDHSELDVKLETQARDLVVAKADLNLVNKDQVDILKSLRASVSVEKDALTKEVERLRRLMQAADDTSKMQMSQINSLLMEKVSLQSDGIGQRERMLQRERDVGDLKASLSGKGLSEADQARFATLQQEHTKFQSDVKDLKDKLTAARKFIKDQDSLLKKAHANEHHGNLDEAEQSYRSQISTLTEELERQKSNNADVEARYRREQQLMLSAWHDLSMRQMRESVIQAAANKTSSQPASWLAQQRIRANGRGLRNA